MPPTLQKDTPRDWEFRGYADFTKFPTTDVSLCKSRGVAYGYVTK